MTGVTKRFGAVAANEAIDLDVRAGEMHAILGENGAGKSTLVSVLYGLIRPDRGEICWKGSPVRIRHPRHALRLGIGMVHQHFMLVPQLTVAENVMLGVREKAWPLLDKRTVRNRLEEVSLRFGLRVDPEKNVEELSVGEQQRAEILRILYRGAELLVLDEPTALLTPQEGESLFHVLNQLKSQGRAVLFITHRLGEVRDWADRVTVLRKGKRVAVLEGKGKDPKELAQLMMGGGKADDLRVEGRSRSGRERSSGDPLLEVRGIRLKGARPLRDISLKVGAGEILAVAGVDGNGQRELAECLDGRRRPETGEILLEGKSLIGQGPRAAARRGLGHVPQDRRGEGVVLEYDLSRNAALRRFLEKPFSRFGFLRHEAMREEAERMVNVYDIQAPGPHTRVKHLSGGNVQKLILARELSTGPKVLIANHPTRGLDIASRNFVWRRLDEAREEDRGVLLISADMDEIMALADRILVLFDGAVAGELFQEEATPSKLGLLMGGAGNA